MITTDIVPATNMAIVKAMPPETQALAITNMLTEARSWLAHAVEATDPTSVANFKAQMATVVEATKQLGLSKEIQLDAIEMVRRAERGVGKAIRGGQERGEISTMGNRNNYGGPDGPAHRQSPIGTLSSPSDFLPTGSDRAATYAITDDVTDEDFDAALTEAKAEGNVSRANVVRKIKAPGEATYSERQSAKWDRVATLAASGSSSQQIARDVGMGEAGVKSGAKQRGIDIRADRILGRVHRLDSNRIIRESVSALENIISGLALINPDDIDQEEAKKWTDSLTASRDALSQAIRKIQKRKSIQ